MKKISLAVSGVAISVAAAVFAAPMAMASISVFARSISVE